MAATLPKSTDSSQGESTYVFDKKYPDIPWHAKPYSTAPHLEFEWPNKARIAVLIHTAFEQWSEIEDVPQIKWLRNSQSDAPPTGWIPEGVKQPYDWSTFIEHDYAGRIGIWRVLDLYKKYGIKGTIACNGLVTERYPEAVKEIARQGHEIAAHSWAQDIRHTLLSPELQHQEIRRCVEAFEKLTGKRPVGWISPGGQATPHLLGFLEQEGFIWCGDPGKNDDLPYPFEVNGRKMMAIGSRKGTSGINACTINMNDFSQRELYERFVDEFDALYEESRPGRPTLIYAVMHAELQTAGLTRLFEKMIQYAKQFSGVWFSNRGEVARHLLDNYVK